MLGTKGAVPGAKAAPVDPAATAGVIVGAMTENGAVKLEEDIKAPPAPPAPPAPAELEAREDTVPPKEPALPPEIPGAPPPEPPIGAPERPYDAPVKTMGFVSA